MKPLFRYLTVLILSACGSSSSSDVKDFIPGTYSNNFTDSIDVNLKTEGTDVLEIQKAAAAGSESYQISRTLNFNRYEAGKAEPGNEKKETWTGFYDEKNKVIKTESEKILSFDMVNNQVIIGDKKYKKLR